MAAEDLPPASENNVTLEFSHVQEPLISSVCQLKKNNVVWGNIN
jgi:hypothetical protein